MSIEAIVSKLMESRVRESTGESEYICRSIKVDSRGVMEIVCYDTVEDEEFEKYIGQVDSFNARKAARLLLRDWKFEVPKDIRNELIGTFGLEDFGYSIEDSTVYYPRDDSGRDNSAEVDDILRQERSHPYVGKKVRWSKDGRVYRVTRAYEDSRGVIVRCGDITMKPEEYKFIRESNTVERMEFATDSEAYEWAKENGYEIDKIQNCKRGKSCIAYMSKNTEV